MKPRQEPIAVQGPDYRRVREGRAQVLSKIHIQQLRLRGGASRGTTWAAVGQECVIAFGGFNDVQPGDVLEAFQLEPTR